MADKIKLLSDLGPAVRALRKQRGLSTVEVASRSGRSRDILHRLETGRDVSAAALLDIVAAMDLAIELVPRGMPTVDEMRRRFAEHDDDAA